MIKNIFISSTVYDLWRERAMIRTFLEHYDKDNIVKIKCSMSDYPDFRITPDALKNKHSYDICTDNIENADYFLLLLKKRYGASFINYESDLISITHLEYREACRKRLPIFIFVDQRTWNAKNRLAKGKTQKFVPDKQIQLFYFIDEIRKKAQGNWISFYRNYNEIETVLRTNLFGFDDSGFVADVTIPDGTLVATGEKFEKIWEIENTGMVVWEGRYLREENSGVSGLAPNATQIPIPRTLPGERVRLAVCFSTPKLPATCESYWKMIDSKGQYCFPHLSGVFCRVKIIPRNHKLANKSNQRMFTRGQKRHR